MIEGLQGGWKAVRLQDLCEQITDGKHGDCNSEQGSGFYFLSCKDVANGKLNYSNARQITQLDFIETHRRTKLAASDVLITHSGTIGRMAIVPDSDLTLRTTFQKSVAILKPIISRVLPHFLYYALQSDILRLIERAGGTAQKNLLLRDLRSFEILVPQLDVQRIVVEQLAVYDVLITNNERRIKILESMARSLYQEWFVNFRFPGHEGVKMVPSSLGEIPEGWEVKALGEVCRRIESGGTPRRNVIEFWEGGTINWFKTGELWDEYLFDSEEKITQLAHEESTARVFDSGTIFMAIYGSPTVGRLGIVTSPSSCNQAALGLVANTKRISQLFLYFTLFTLRDHFNGLAQGAAQQNISKEKVVKTLVLVPTLGLVTTFDREVGPMFDQIETLQRSVMNLRKTRDLLLPMLLSGRADLDVL